ncbi:DUF3177 family protein [Lyngbya aestuarii]|uniref:DUF3177 family protein n=1 Tax=Lyngbya aestuarii TaxID=118322 RepID=UPI00403DCA3C
MQDEILRALVWTDYRLAVLFTAIIPLTLLIWAFVRKADAIVRLLIIYWRVASLLAITVYLLIAGWPVGFVSSFCAKVLIPVSLWFWVDVNEDIDDQPQRPLKLALTSWRWAVTVYCGLGAVLTIPFLRCAFINGLASTTFCQVWMDPPLLFKQYFHSGSTPEFLGFMGIVGLVLYVLYLSYFVLIRLGKQGRSAMEQ